MKDCLYIENSMKKAVTCDFLTKQNALQVERFVSTYSGYTQTPLVCLDDLAKEFNVQKIYVKDESKRMGLKAFKVIGVLYGTVKTICATLNIDINTVAFNDLVQGELNKKIRQLTLIAATDGNHGRGLAFVAQKLGCKCRIFMPNNATDARIKAIESFGAEVFVTDMNYDNTLLQVIEEAKQDGCLHIQDQAWEGYEEVTNSITQGYTIIALEILKQIEQQGNEAPTHIILQAGAGTFAFGILGFFTDVYKDQMPIMALCEPHNANPYYVSVQNKERTQVFGDLETVMAGLSVGETNHVAWNFLKNVIDGSASCSDYVTAKGMRILGNPYGNDERIVSGESGALGFGFFSMIANDSAYEDILQKMKINEHSRLLFINTEGDTDPHVYRDIVWNGLFAQA